MLLSVVFLGIVLTKKFLHCGKTLVRGSKVAHPRCMASMTLSSASFADLRIRRPLRRVWFGFFCGLRDWRRPRLPLCSTRKTGASWWLFAGLWLAPDLSLLGYLAGPSWGARIYNAIHSYVTPATLAVSALLLRSPALLPFALIWINHIGVDRLLGYGLKYPAGFGMDASGPYRQEARRSYSGNACSVSELRHERTNRDSERAKADQNDLRT